MMRQSENIFQKMKQALENHLRPAPPVTIDEFSRVMKKEMLQRKAESSESKLKRDIKHAEIILKNQRPGFFQTRKERNAQIQKRAEKLSAAFNKVEHLLR